VRSSLVNNTMTEPKITVKIYLLSIGRNISAETRYFLHLSYRKVFYISPVRGMLPWYASVGWDGYTIDCVPIDG
jgi:hypothetical protein